MRMTYDPRADALAIELRDVPVARTCEVTDTVNVDLGKDGRPVVVEILNVRKGLGVEVLQHVGLDLGGIQWHPEQDAIYATDEAAKLVGVSRQYLSKMAREKKIPARRSGRDWLFYRSGLVEFFGAGRVGKAQAPLRGVGAHHGMSLKSAGSVKEPAIRVARARSKRCGAEKTRPKQVRKHP